MVAVVTDSTACLPAQLAARHGVEVVPLHVVVDGATYAEGQDITSDELAAALRAHRRVSTSKPSPSELLGVYRSLAEQGADAVVSVHLSSRLSATTSSAQLAAQQSPVPVTVVDSRSLAMGLGFAVLAAARAAAEGAGAQEVARVARERAERSTVLFGVDTLEHLRRGGRLGRASALLGSALAVKPVLALHDGVVEARERVRTAAKVLRRLDALAAEAVGGAGGDGTEVAVMHLDAAGRAQELQELLGRSCPGLGEIPVLDVGAVVGAHAGPGVVGVVVAPPPAP